MGVVQFVDIGEASELTASTSADPHHRNQFPS